MNNTEAGELLRLRRALTGGTYNDETIAAWAEALAGDDYEQCRAALIKAALTEKKITVAHVVEHLPKRASSPARRIHCELCDGTGLVSTPPHRAHNPRYCHPTPERPCFCSAVEPCRCTAGKPMLDVVDRIVEHNSRNRRDVDEPALQPRDWRRLKAKTRDDVEQNALPL